MTAKNKTVFLDADAIIYVLDLTNDQHNDAVSVIMKLGREQAPLCTSHHVIEEVVRIVQESPDGDATPVQVVERIAKISDLTVIEPDSTIEFAKRYAALGEELHMEIADAFLLQLMLDAGISRLFSYDTQLVDTAAKLHITSVTG